HHAADDVTGLEGKADVGQALGEFAPQALAQLTHPHMGAGLELHLDDALLRAAVPEVNQVDGVARRVDANKPQGDLDVGRPHFVFDNLQNFERNGFGALDLRAGRRAEAHLKLSQVNTGKNLRAELPADEHQDERGSQQVNAQHQPAHADDPVQSRSVAFLEPG